MPATLDSAHAIITDLVHTFQQNQTHFLSPRYQEAEARKDFIDKFFVALGWDVNHDAQTNPTEQEVKIERGVTVATMQKRADYAFYFAPNFRDVRFFVEAKKPSVDLSTNADAYFQTLRYGWNAQTPLAVLTDFEQFHILDCRAKPDIRTALQRAHKTYRYTDFLDKERFAEVYWLFSRQALAEGAFDRAIASLPKLKAVGKQMGLLRTSVQPVDASFLDELEQHREALAKSLKRDNPLLDGLALTEVTQRVLDRLVFLRFLEDKLIETEVSVAGFARSAAPWADFIADSRKLNARYNGAVYKPHPLIDASRLAVSDDDFRDVCEQLSDRHSPFDFNAIPIHILGSIYERFLGKVIVATDKRATVQEKPEVRKAGGVYYTPEYIVRYIVDQTVGALIADKSPAEIAKLHFADIACGSGSFLLGVYDTLLRHHTRWFNENPDKADRAGCVPTDDGAWRLSLRQRRDILTNNIFGVDIDQQAVEVTQVSLYLKLLEDETTASSHQYEIQFHDTLLPNLGNNIKCGNSLIGTDILSGQMFTTDEERALNPMDFEDAFPAVMKAGGFDAIVGNPPYIRIQTLNETNPEAVAYFGARYASAAKGNYDIYVVFVERALKLLNGNGLLGYILPHKFFNAKYGEGLRGLIAQGKHLKAIVHFGDQQVFDGATTYTCLLFLSKKEQISFDLQAVKNLREWSLLYIAPSTELISNFNTSDPVESANISVDQAHSGEWTFARNVQTHFQIQTNNIALDNFAHVFQGLATSADSVYVLERRGETKNNYIVRSKELGLEEFEIEKSITHSLLKGAEINRYLQPIFRNVILFPYKIENEKAVVFSERELKQNFPLAYKYILQTRSRLLNRSKVISKNYWHYPYPKNLTLYNKPKILVQVLSTTGNFTYDKTGDYFFLGGGTAGGNAIRLEENSEYSYLYLLGILNSKLLTLHVHKNGSTFRGGFYAFGKGSIGNFPIRPINFDDAQDKAKHERMVQLVTQMLDAKQKQAGATTERDIDYYANRCAGLDRQIDALVYDLYGLTEAEIAIVEAG